MLMVSVGMLLRPTSVLAASAPTITSVAPTTSAITGGDTVTLTGTGFVAGDTVTVNGVSATGMTVTNSTTLSFTVPLAPQVGPAPVIVTDTSSQSSSPAILTYTLPAPTISSIAPTSGPALGGQGVTVTGSGLYTPNNTTNSWSAVAGKTLPSNLAWEQRAVIGNTAYIFGGLTASTTATNIIYSASTSDPTTWTNTGKTLPGALAGAQLAVVGNTMYLIGGFTGNGTASNVIYSASTSDPTTWTNTGKTLPGALGESQLAVVGNTMYLIGGFTGASYTATNVIYSASTSDPTTWTNTGKTLPASLYQSQLTTIGNTLYLFGGQSAGATSTIYSASTSDPTTWTNTGKTLPGVLTASHLMAIGNTLYLFGGVNSGYTNVIYSASTSDPTTWTNTGKTLSSNVAGSSPMIIGSNVYLLGGVVASGTLTNAIYNAPVTQIFPNQYNPSWSTSWNTDTTTNFSYKLSMGGAQATNVTATSSTSLTATTPAGSNTVDVQAATYAGVTSNTLTGAYTYTNPNITNVSPNSGPLTGGQGVTLTGTNFGTADAATANAWTNTAKTLPASRYFSATAVVGNTIYSYGGLTGTGTTASNAIYSASTSDPTTWTNTGKTLPASLGWTSLAVIGNTMYLFGGYTGSTAVNTIYTASTSDPTTWTSATKTLPSATYAAQLAIVGSTIYLFGGATNTILSAPVSNPTAWTNTGATLPAAINQAALAIANGNIYLFGGYVGGTPANTIYSAPITNPLQWTNTGATLPTTLAAHQIMTMGNNMYILGGKTGGSAATSVSTIYTATTSNPTVWTNTGATLPGVLEASQAFVAGNAMYLIGGYNASAVTSVIYSAPLTTTGTNLYNLPWLTTQVSPSISFGGTPATWAQYISPTTMMATTPAHTSGVVTVAETNTDGQSTTLANGYTYNPPASIGSTIPSSGSIAGGDVVTLTGTGFVAGDTVTVGGVTATNVSVVNGSTLTFTTPAGLQVGPKNIIVTDSYGQASAAQVFTYVVPAPTIGSITPSSGPARGSQAVTVAGSGFYAPNSMGDWVGTGKTLPISTNGAASFVANDTMYFMGGRVSTAPTVNNAKIYAASSAAPTTWTQVGTMPVGLAWPSVFRVGNAVYLMGGMNGSDTNTKAIYRADLSDLNTWTLIGNLPTVMAQSPVTIVGDHAYMFGGYIGATISALTRTSTIYSAPLSDLSTWTAVGSLPGAVSTTASTITIGTKLYKFGGFNGSNALNTIYTADTSDPTQWTLAGTLPTTLNPGGIVAVGKNLYLLGATTTGSSSTGTNAIYTASVDNPLSWSVSAKTMPGTVSGGQLLSLDDQLYYFSGVNTSGAALNIIYSAPVTRTFPNQYNPSWTTNWYTDATTDYGYKLNFGGAQATNVTATGSGILTATTPAGTGTVDVRTATYSGLQSNTLTQAYTYKTPSITTVTPSQGPSTGAQNAVITGTNLDTFGDASTIPATANAWASTGKSLPVAPTSGNQTLTVVVNSTIYIYTGTTIETASTSAPSTVTKSTNTLPVAAGNSPIVQIGSKLYIYTTHILVADTADPTSWADTGIALTGPTGTRQIAIAGSKVYLFGAGSGHNAIYSAPLSNPTNMTDTGATLPAYRDYGIVMQNNTDLYLLGGRSSSATTSDTNTIYRASISDPLTWTSVGTLPVAESIQAGYIVGNTAYLAGGASVGSSINTIYSAPISDLTSWTNTGQTLAVAMQNENPIIAGGSIYMYGGWTTALVGTIYSAPLTQTGTDYYSMPWLTDAAKPISSIMFGGSAATNVEYLNASSLIATTPAHASGSVNVVANDVVGQTSTLPSGYTYIAPPTASNLTPTTEILTGGDTITMTGSNFSAGSSVTVNGVSATSVNVSSSTSLSFTAPASLQIGPASVVITDSLGQASAPLTLNYTIPAPTISSIAPNSGPARGGQAVTVAGSGFYAPNSLDLTAGWTKSSKTLPSSFDWSQRAVIGDTIYLFGGTANATSGTTAIFTAKTSDPETWTQATGTLPAGVWASQTAVIGNYVYLFGGVIGTAGTANIYRAPISDPTNWGAGPVATLPAATGFSSLAIANGRVYLYGGTTTTTSANTTNVIYSASLNDPTSWIKETATLPVALSSSQAMVIGNKVYLFGGQLFNSGGSPTPTNAIYSAPTNDPTNFSPSPVGTLPGNLSHSHVVAIGNSLYLLGGHNGSAYINTIYSASVTDPTTWVNSGKTFPLTLAASQATAINGKLWFFGGFINGAYSNAIYSANTTQAFPNQYNNSWTTNWTTDTTTDFRYKLALGGTQATNVTAASSTTLTATTPAGTGAVNVQAATYANLQSNNLTKAYTYKTPTITATYPSQGPSTGGQNTVITGQNFDSFGDQSTTAATTNTWTSAGTLPASIRLNNMVAIVGSTAYMYGGYSGSASLSTIYSAPVNNMSSWTNTGKTLPTILNSGTLAVIGNKMYIFGGSTTAATNNIYTANTSDPTTWTITGTLPAALAGAQLAIVDNTMYLFGGFDGSGALNTIYTASLSDPMHWTNTGKTLPFSAYGFNVKVFGSNLYIFGGNTNTASSAGVLNTIYTATTADPTTWTNTGKTLPVAMQYMNMPIIGNTVYMIGGSSSAGTGLNTIYTATTADPTTWTNTGKTLPAGLSDSGMLIANNSIYLLGGLTSATATNAIYRAPIETSGTDYYNLPWTSNLTSPISTLSFGGLQGTNVEYFNPSTLVATTPPHTAGTVDVLVNDTVSQSSTLTNGYAYIAPPVAGSLAPSTEVLTGGDIITMSGSNFSAGSTVTVNGVPATNVNVVNSNSLTFTAPAGLQIGSAQVVVTDSLGQASNSVTLTYTLPSPTLSSIAPNSGPVSGGQNVTVTGNGFYLPNSTTNTWSTVGGKTLPTNLIESQLAVVGNTIYSFGGATASGAYTAAIYSASTSDPTTWTNTGKTLPSGIGYAQLAVIGGNLYLFGGYNGSAAQGTVYSASTSDPTTWTNTGKTLPSGLWYSHVAVVGNTVYLFGGVIGSGGTGTAGSTVIYSASTSDPTTWTNTGKTLPVGISEAQLVTLGSSLYLYGGYVGGTISNTIYSASTSDPTTWTNTGKTLPATLASSTVVTVGTNIYLLGGYNGTANTAAIYSASTSDPTTWTNTGKTLPVGTYERPLTAVINGYLYLFGGYTSTFSNAIQRTPIEKWVFPNQYNPTWLTNWNTDTATDYSYKLSLGGTAAINVNPTNSTTLVATTASHTAGTVNTVVHNDGVSQDATLANSYTYVAPPTVTSFTPATEQVGRAGDTITITGSDFANGATVSFGGMSASVTNVTSTTITATIPTGTAVDRVTITVTNPDGQSVDALGKFAYTLAPPTIISIAPNKGTMDGNTNVTLTGSGFLQPNSTTNSWSVAAGKSLPAVTRNAGTMVVGGKVYMLGGYNASAAVNTIYSANVSDPTTWTNTGKTLPAAVEKPAVAQVGDRLFLYGNPNIYWANVSDPTTWYTSANTLPMNAGAASLAIVGNTMYLYKGTAVLMASTNDPTTWTNTGVTLPKNFNYSALAVIGDTMYDFGGWTGSASLNSIATANVSDPTTWTIAPGKTLPTTISDPNFMIIGSNMYIFGAQTSGSTFSSAIYSATTSDPTTWKTTAAAIPSGGSIFGGSVFAVNNSLYIAGGFNSSGTTISSIESASVTHSFPNQYNQPWSTNWYSDPSAQNYSLTFDGVQATKVTATSATTMTATTPAHAPAATDIKVTTYDGNASNTLANSYTYLPDAYAITSAPFTVMANQPASFTVQMRDNNGNPVTSEDPVTLQLTSSSNGASFANSQTGPWNLTSITIPAGQSSATIYYRDSVKGTPTITATDPLGATATQQETITSAYKIIVTGVTDPTNVGVPSSVTVQAVDWQDAAQPDFRGTVTFSSTDGAATLPTNYTFTSADLGRHTFTNGVVFGTEGEWSVTATDTSDSTVTGTQDSITVGPPAAGTASQIVFITQPQGFSLDDTSGTITVQLQDSVGTPVVVQQDTTLYLRTNSTGGEFSIDGGATWQAGPVAVTIPANTSTSSNFIYRDTQAGVHVLTVSQFPTNNFGWKVAQQNVYVGVGGAQKVQLTNAVNDQLLAGQWVPVTVGLSDIQNNPVNAPADSPIHLSISGAGYLSSSADGSAPVTTMDVVVPAGTQTVTVYIQGQSGNVTLSATDSRTLSDGDAPYINTSTIFVVAAAAAYKVGLVPASWNTSTQHGSQTVHTAQKMTVTLYDVYGNVALSNTDAVINLSSQINDPAQNITAVKGTNGFFGLTSTTAANSTLAVTVPAGSSTLDVYYQQNIVTNGVTLTADNAVLQQGTVLEDVVPAGYAHKLLWVNPNYTYTDANGDTKTPTSDAELTSDPAAFANFIATNAQYAKSLTTTAGDAKPFKVYLADQWGNPTAATSSVTLGLAGSNTAANTDGTTKAQWASSATGPWNNMVVSPSPFELGIFNPAPDLSSRPVSMSYTINPVANSTAPSFATVYYKDTVAGRPTVSVIDRASSAWTQTRVRPLYNRYENTALNTKTVIVTAGRPTGYTVTSAPQTVVTNTASSPITLQLVDAFGNETSSDTDVSMTLTTSSSTGNFSSNGTDWSNDTLTITIPAGTTHVNAYYKDSATSPTNGFVITASESASDIADPAKPTLTSATQNLRTILGVPNKDYLDLHGVTTTAAGVCVPATLITTTTVKTDGQPDQDQEAVVLANTTFSLSPSSRDNGFYTSSSCTTGSEVNSVVMAKNTSEVQLWVKFNSANSYNLNAQANGFTAGTSNPVNTMPATLNVTAAGVYKLGFSAIPSSFVVGRNSGAIAVSTEDQFGNILLTDTDRTVNVSSSSAGGTFTGGASTYRATIAAQTSTTTTFIYTNGSFDIYGNLTDQTALGDQTLTAQTAGLNNAAKTITGVGIDPVSLRYLDDSGAVISKISLVAGDKKTVHPEFMANDGKPAILPGNVNVSLQTLELANENPFSAEHGDDLLTSTSYSGGQLHIPAGYASEPLTIEPHTAENHRLKAETFYGPNASSTRIRNDLEVDVTAGAPDGLKATGSTQTIHPQIPGDTVDGDAKSAAINIYLIDKFGNRTSSNSDTTISLSSSCATGHFLSGSNVTTTIVIGAGNQSAATWYQDTSASSTPCTMSFTAPGLVTTTQDIFVIERVFSLKAAAAKNTVEAGESDNVTVTPLDRFGNVVQVTDQSLQLNVASSGTDSASNVMQPSPLTIPIGSNTGTITFTHAAALAASIPYTLQITNANASQMTTSTTITVVPGAAAKLKWNKPTYAGTTGDILPVIVQLTNQFGYAVPATENMDIGLTTTAGLNVISGKQSGTFFSDSAGLQSISSIQLAQGETTTATFYYQQTQTTKDVVQSEGYNNAPPVEVRNGTARPAAIYANYNTLTSANSSLSIAPINLYFADTTNKVSVKGALQARSCYALKLTASKAMPFDQTYDLSTTMGTNDGNFYASCSTPPGRSEAEMPDPRLTQITIKAGQTQSTTFYYHQTRESSYYEWTWNQAAPVASQADNWSTNLNTLEAIKTVTGNVDHIAFVKPGGSSASTDLATLTQNQPGTYVIETRDNLDNPTSLIQAVHAGEACVYVAVDVPAGDTNGKLTSNNTGSCPAVSGKIAIAMTSGQTQGSFTYSSMKVGAHTLRADTSSSMASSVYGQKAITVTAAQTDHILFSKPTYAMIRGTNVNVTVSLAGGQWDAITNTLGDTPVTLTSSSASGEWFNASTNTWAKTVTVTVPAGQTQITAKYRDNTADLGSYTITGTANGLTPATAEVVLTTGTFSNVAFQEQAQTLELQQAGNFTAALVDDGGNPITAANDQCLFVTVPSTTATFATSNSSDSCPNLTLPNGSTAYGIVVNAGQSSANFTLSDAAVGQYTLTVTTNPVSPASGLTDTQSLTIIAGDPTSGTLEKSAYTLERGDTIDTKVVLRNAYGAVVPATDDTYLKLTTSSDSGQFASSTADPMQSTLIALIPKDSTGTELLYTDSNPTIGTSQITVHHVTQGGLDITNDSLADSTTPVTIVYGTPAMLTFTSDPRSTVATHPSEVMIAELQNKFGYTTVANQDLSVQVASDSTTGQFAIGQDGPWGVTSTIIPAGVSSVSLYYHDTTEGLYRMQVSSQLTIDGDTITLVGEQPHTITRQALDHFEVTNISTPQQAGTPSSVVVFAEDSEGFVVQWYTGTVHFSASTNDAIYPIADYTFTTADKGMHTFKNSIAFRAAGVKSITATDSNGLTGTQYNIIVGNPNTNPIKSIAFIDPETADIDLLKNVPTDAMTLQLRDAANVPTTPINSQGLPIHLTSDSPTGQFATSPSGPWSSSIDVTVARGLSFTTTPFYYQDSTGGAHTITAADWAAGFDDQAIVNGSLIVRISDVKVDPSLALYSQDYSGALQQNHYLFSRNETGAINGYATATLTAHDVITGDSSIGDWQIKLQDKDNAVVDTQAFAQQSAVNYRTPNLSPQRAATSYTLSADVIANQLTGSIRSSLPVSPWLATLSHVTYQNQTIEADLSVANGNAAADAPDLDVFIPGTSFNRTLASLEQAGQIQKTGTGSYHLTAALEKPLGGTQYTVVASLHDPLGIIAQDSGFVQGEATSVTPLVTTPADSAPQQPIASPVQQPSAPSVPAKSSSSTPLRLNETALQRFLRSPYAPTIVASALFGLLAAVGVVLAYQAYREWKRARWLKALVVRTNQLVADKNSFLNLAAHHLRTPLTLLSSGAELMQSLSGGTPSVFAANLNRGVAKLRLNVEQVLAETTDETNQARLVEERPEVRQNKIFASPIFWLPIILSVILTVIANWAIATYGDRTIGGVQMLNQIFLLILGVVVIYTAVRMRMIRREQTRLLTELQERVEKLEQAKSAFARRVYENLSGDVLTVDALVQEAKATGQENVLEALTDGGERLKSLLARFALLDNLPEMATHRSDFDIATAVDQALHDLNDTFDVNTLQINNTAQNVHLHQDKYLVVRVLENVLQSMHKAIGSSNITIAAKQDSKGVTLNVTGPATDVPAEGMFSVLSSSDNEEVGTINEDSTEQRLDLYLDRIIVNSLGGSISATKFGDQLRVSLSLPAL